MLVNCRGEVEESHWRFLLTGGVALENPFPNPAPEWLADKSWAEIVRCNDLPAFNGIMRHFRTNVRFPFLRLLRYVELSTFCAAAHLQKVL